MLLGISLRGKRRGVRHLNSQVFDLELAALSKIAMQGLNFKLAIPFVTHANELRRAEEATHRHNLNVQLGAVIETPAAVSTISDICNYAKFVLINVDTLSELMLAVDRSNMNVQNVYDVNHDAVRNAGKMSAVSDEPSIIKLHGVYMYRSWGFSPIGRVRYDYGKGWWDEWYCVDNEGKDTMV